MELWEKLIEFQEELVVFLDTNFTRYSEKGLERFNHSGWVNLTWKSDRFRRIHLDVVDARETKKLWMMHICGFPHIESGAPIYGFDVIAGHKKVTGAFHDFSVVDPNHSAISYFDARVSNLEWSKERQLPDWAKAIFSKNMIAAGNIQKEEELDGLLSVVKDTTAWYFESMADEGVFDARDAQNKYAYFQKQNPHTPRTMKALGLDEQDVDFFVSKCLFPEVI